MQTALEEHFKAGQEGAEADAILRSCVHCGFCTATCPTFLLTGNELDSPRGRIYLIKQVLEGNKPSRRTQLHLDRCLSCQSCETTCPSDVNYHRLLDIGRQQVDRRIGRKKRLQLWLLRTFLQNPRNFKFWLTLGQLFRWMLPGKLKQQIPRRSKSHWPKTKQQVQHQRRMLVLGGCVQSSLSPNTNAAVARVLDRLGIRVETLKGEGCCGALAYHSHAQSAGLERARRQLDRLCLTLDDGVECIISSASGCGNFMQDYPTLFKNDAAYAEKARRVSAHTRDIAEILEGENLASLRPQRSMKLSFHCPCTLQHGLQRGGRVEALLENFGFQLSGVENGHLCCGSAGTYSILQPEFSRQLQARKIQALEADEPDAIATANIGCQHHLQAVSKRPVKHWIEYLDEAL